MKIHQFVHTLNYGDAISGEAIAIKKLLNRMSIESEIYVVHAHEKVKSEVKHWQHFHRDNFPGDNFNREKNPDVAVILHYSIASPLNQLFSELEEVTRIIIYHNLTPEHWFVRYNARVLADLRQGISELPSLLAVADLVLADSSFNRDELHNLGCLEAKVLALPLDEEKWSVPANSGIAHVLRGHGGRNFLHVGRLAPNKCIEDIIKAFYFYHHKIDKKSRLWLIGADIDTEIYSFELRGLVSEFRLKEAVSFVGSVADSELRAFYENSDLYLCMSEHEGFCVPLLEAMHFGLPVVAYRACAVEETLGQGGLLLAKKSPAELAELMHLIVNDSDLRQSLIAKGLERVKYFSSSHFAKHLEQELVKPLLENRIAPKRFSNSLSNGSQSKCFA